MDETSQVPCEELLHVHKVSDCARFFPCKPFAMGRCCLLFNGRDRHLGIRPVSQLNTWPVVSPVNASRRPSRDAAHHSGSGRMASPYPMGDFHLLFFASFSWRTPNRVIRDRVEPAASPAMSAAPLKSEVNWDRAGSRGACHRARIRATDRLGRDDVDI